MKKFLFLLFLGISMTTSAEQPEWVQELFTKLGPEIMAKPAHELSGEDLFNIYHATKNINGVDDGVWPMFEMYGDKVIPVLKAKLSDSNTSSEEIATAKEIVNIFFEGNSELRGLSGN